LDDVISSVSFDPNPDFDKDSSQENNADGPAYHPSGYGGEDCARSGGRARVLASTSAEKESKIGEVIRLAAELSILPFQTKVLALPISLVVQKTKALILAFLIRSSRY
jgi:hypothetical protein